MSTAEAEYVALSEASQEAISIRRVLHDIDENTGPILIMEDNQAAIAIANDPMFHTRTKHIAIKSHFVREQLKNKKIAIEHCPTHEMIADALTKPLSFEMNFIFG